VDIETLIMRNRTTQLPCHTDVCGSAFLTSTLCRGEWLGSHSGIHWIGGRVASITDLDVVASSLKN
jgi:hypothetical protein